MKLSDLREVQSEERRTDSLGQLPESFYEDVAEYIQGLKAERDRAAERADDPFDDPDIDRLTDEINAAEQVAEAIYDRRVGKIVRQAGFAAAGMDGDVEGLTAEEQRLYEDVTERIAENKSDVLEVLGGDSTPESTTTPEPGGDDLERSAGKAHTEKEQTADEGPVEADGGTAGRATVRVTQDIGEVFGVDERAYRLEAEDVVSLPEENADALVEKNAAERL